MPRVKLCANSKHVWIRKRKRDVCEICKTQFPCKSANCGHLDCAEAREIGIERWDKENT